MIEGSDVGGGDAEIPQEISNLNDVLIKDEIVAVDELEDDPSLIGVTCNSEEEAYQLYCEYAYAEGFNVRKGKQYYWEGTDRLIKTKIFVCNKAGEKESNRKRQPLSTRLTKRTSCGAFIKFFVSKDGRWEVIAHVKEHNHILATPQNAHLLRSAKKITKSRDEVLLNLRNLSCDVGGNSESMYCNEVARYAYKLADRSRSSKEARVFVLEGMSGIEKRLEAHFMAQNLQRPGVVLYGSDEPFDIDDPLAKRPKGPETSE